MNADAKKRYQEIPFPFICPLSNREFLSGKGLSVYVTKTLKMNHSEYYDKYVNHRESNCFFCGDKGGFISISKGYRNLCEKKSCLEKTFSSHTIEGFMYRNMCSREEAEKLFHIENERQLQSRLKTQSILREEDPLWDKKRSRNCIEFWLNKGLTKDEAEIKVAEVMKEIHKKTSDKLRSNREKYASKYPTKIEYYLKRGLTKDEASKRISKIQNRFSLKGCIEKWGKEEGEKIFLDRQNRWINTLNSKSEEEKIEINRKKLFNNSGYSKVSQELFWRVYDNFQTHDVRFEELNSEIIRFDKSNNRHYKYDYVDFTNKKCIEFNGDYWHCNPKKYNETFIHPIMKVEAKEIWEKDTLKNLWMEQRGYRVLTIWESEYRKNPQQALQKCIKFINE